MRCDLLHEPGMGIRPERAPSHEQFVHHNAQAEDIAAAVDAMPLTARLFRAHVRGGSDITGPFADVGLPECHAEVDNVGRAGLVNQDVAGLDIAMHQAAGVRMMQGRRHGADQLGDLQGGRPRLLHGPCQADAFNVF